MDRQPTLTGERLRLRPLQADDWDALWTIAQDRALWAMHPMHDRWQEPVFRAFFADALAKIGARLTDRSDFAQTPEGPVRHVIYEIDRAGFAATQTGRDRARPVGWQ